MINETRMFSNRWNVKKSRQLCPTSQSKTVPAFEFVFSVHFAVVLLQYNQRGKRCGLSAVSRGHEKGRKTSARIVWPLL